MEVNQDIVKLHEAYKKHTGNLNQEAAGHLVVAHALMEIDKSLANLIDTVDSVGEVLGAVDKTLNLMAAVIENG